MVSRRAASVEVVCVDYANIAAFLAEVMQTDESLLSLVMFDYIVFKISLLFAGLSKF